MAKERDIQIDILRCIGLLLVILAHVPINETVKSIRSFDVMLLVMIAGISFVKSGRNKKEFDYKRYLVGRIKRLCVPTWLLWLSYLDWLQFYVWPFIENIYTLLSK